jgi:Bacterial Ig-like domain (group 2)
MKWLRAGLASGFAIFAIGCVAARVEQLSPTRYPPTDPEQVTVFMDPAELRADSIRYDRIAMIFTQGSSEFTSSDQHLHKAREEAARLGANGIVVQSHDPGGRYNWFWGTSSQRESSVMAIHWYTVPVTHVPSPGAAQSDVAAVVLEPSTDTLGVGEERQLVATAHSSSGVTVEGRLFRWKSSSDSIASVSPAGLVTAHVAGSVVVVAATDSIKGTATIVVRPQ